MKTKQHTKILFLLSFLTLVSIQTISAEDISVTVVVKNVEASKGQVFLAAFNNEATYKKNQPMKTLASSSTPGTVTFTIDVPEGEYVFSVYQDLNNNGKLDTNFIGMPKEPVGISGYSGSGIPGGFEKLKVKIAASSNSVEVSLKKL